MTPLDERTLLLTHGPAVSLPFTLAGGLRGSARGDSMRYDTRSQRLAGGRLRVGFNAADPQRRVPLAMLPAEVDSLVVQGDAIAPTAALHALALLYGRAIGARLALRVDESDVAAGAPWGPCRTTARPSRWSAAARSRSPRRDSPDPRGSRSPCAGPWQRDLVLEADLRALGRTQRLSLRIPSNGDGAAQVLSASPATAIPGASVDGPVRLDSLQLARLAWSVADGFDLRILGSGRLLLPLRAGGAIEVPVPSVLLTAADVQVSATRVRADQRVTIAEGVAATATSWDLPIAPPGRRSRRVGPRRSPAMPRSRSRGSPRSPARASARGSRGARIRPSAGPRRDVPSRVPSCIGKAAPRSASPNSCPSCPPARDAPNRSARR